MWRYWALIRTCPEKTKPEEWNHEGLKKWYQEIFQKELGWRTENFHRLDRDAFYAALKDEIIKAYEDKEKALTPGCYAFPGKSRYPPGRG